MLWYLRSEGVEKEIGGVNIDVDLRSYFSDFDLKNLSSCNAGLSAVEAFLNYFIKQSQTKFTDNNIYKIWNLQVFLQNSFNQETPTG